MARPGLRTEPAGEAPSWVYAGFWIRVWASVIDSALLLLVLFPFLGWLVPAASGPGTGSHALLRPDRQINAAALAFMAPSLPGPLHILFYWVLPAVIVVLFWWAREATPGKMAIHARIVDAGTGQPANKAQLVIRYLGYYVSSLPLGLGLIWVGIDARKQGWHDKLAGTVVVRPRHIAEAVAAFPSAHPSSESSHER